MHTLLYFLLTLHVLVCLLMVLVVLMQRPRNEGLGAAFGSGMTDNIFGAQTTNVLAKFTTWLGGIFFVLTLALAMVYARLYSGQTTLTSELSKLPAPAPAAAVSATPAPVGEPLPAQPSPAAVPVESVTAPPATPASSATPAPTATITPTPATPAPTAN